LSNARAGWRAPCASCDFYILRQSSQAQLLGARHGPQGKVVEISTTDSGLAVVEGDQDAIDRLITGLAGAPGPDHADPPVQVGIREGKEDRDRPHDPHAPLAGTY